MKGEKVKKICYGIYIGYVVVAFGLSFFIKDDFELNILSNSINVIPQVLSFFILVATSISLYAVSIFEENKDTILQEAKKVGIDLEYSNKIKEKFNFIEHIVLKCIVASCGFFALIIGDFANDGCWQECTYTYACTLVGILIALTLYGYIYFLIIIFCIKDVYDSDFNYYSYAYPLATDIFEKFNQICTFGLVCFWVIGFILIGLSFVVFNVNALAVLLIIGVLIGIGYVVFTFYPYYKTRRKVSLLKMQTIRDLCQEHDLLSKDGYEKFSPIINFIWESPTVLTTNFNLVLTSTIAAIASLLTPLISILR